MPTREITRTLRTQAQMYRQMGNDAQANVLERAAGEIEGLRTELAALKGLAVTLYYGGLLSPEMCAKIEEYAAQDVEEER